MKWTPGGRNPIFLYTYDDDSECIRVNSPDIFMSQPPSDVSFRNGTQFYELPRKGLQSVFYEPLRWLTEGPSHAEQCNLQFDTRNDASVDLEVFVGVLGKASLS